MVGLPDTPSNLISLALEDLIKVEKIEQYEVNMDQWHCPSVAYGGDFLFCHVCFAGAVMAMTMKSSIVHYCDPKSFENPISDKLHALEYFRHGSVDLALDYMGIKVTRGNQFDREIPTYKVDKRKFKSAMSRLARDLKEAGL